MTEASARPAAATAIYRGMDRAALDAAYNNGAAVADSADWLVRWRELSAAVRASPRARLDIPYGSRPRARFDYFPCGAARAPLFVLIHGGGSATTRTSSPSSPRDRTPMASTSPSSATRWRRTSASPTSSAKSVK